MYAYLCIVNLAINHIYLDEKNWFSRCFEEPSDADIPPPPAL